MELLIVKCYGKPNEMNRKFSWILKTKLLSKGDIILNEI